MATTYGYTGAEQTHSVASSTDAVKIECYGAQGQASDYGDPVANGGYSKGILDVSGGETLYIYVGEQPPQPSYGGSTQGGGWNGGGDPGKSGTKHVAGGGGGASDVRFGGNTLSDRIIAAGGGGGNGCVHSNSGNGYGGGNSGGKGSSDSSTNEGGDGGTQSAGGAGGSGGYDSGNAGSSLNGGHGGGNTTASDASGGGGGGGGYYGGGGGGCGSYANGCGGGGSGYVGTLSSTTMIAGDYAGGDGQVVITELEKPASPDNVTTTVNGNGSITLSWDTDTTGGTPDHYDIQMSRDGATYTAPADTNTVQHSSGTTSYSVTLNPNSDNAYGKQVGIDSSFQFRVNATNSAGTSAWSASGTAYTDPIPPHNPSVNRPDGGTVEITHTIQSDIADRTVVEVREDTGAGYGTWDWFDTISGGETHVTGTYATGNTVTATYNVGTKYQGGIALSKDSRYQFRFKHFQPGKVSDSNISYTDYGNSGNVFFSDDFERTTNDLTNWTSFTDGDSEEDIMESADIDDEEDTGISGPDSGSHFLMLQSDGQVTKNLGDLSGESDVIVKCVMAAGSMDSASEVVGIDWYDGAAWQTLRNFGYAYNEQGWVEVTALVPSSYLSTDNRVRLDGYGGGGDYLAVDRVVVSDVLHEYTTPAAPSSLGLDTTIEDEITASWTDNATFEESYRIDYKRTSSSTWTTEAQPAPNTTSETIQKLDDGERYDVRVFCWIHQERHGSGNTFFNSPNIAGAATALLPAPTGLTLDAVNGDQADVSWTPNHDYGDQRVEVKHDGGAWTIDGDNLGLSASTYTTTNLLDGEQYDLSVVAYTEHTSTRDQ